MREENNASFLSKKIKLKIAKHFWDSFKHYIGESIIGKCVGEKKQRPDQPYLRGKNQVLFFFLTIPT